MEIISATPVFLSITSPKSFPAEIQLAVTLFRFGNDGSGSSFQRVAEHFGVSDAGMIRTCTDRVIQALLSVESQYIVWPTVQERNAICNLMKTILPGCVGYIDGTHIPLFEAPTEDHDAYFSRKQQYGMQVQAVCDNNLVFRSISVGFPASAHDSRVFLNSPLGIMPERYLSEGQWIAGDSAYRASKYIVTPFRENACEGTRRQRRNFNRHFSAQRVKIEHAFGVLKMVFGSLRSLRVRVNKATGHRRACEWITACCVLYNIIKPEISAEIIPENYINEAEFIDNNNINDNRDGTQRTKVFEWFLQTY